MYILQCLKDIDKEYNYSTFHSFLCCNLNISQFPFGVVRHIKQENFQVLITGPLYSPLRITKLSGGWNSSNQVTSETVTPFNWTLTAAETNDDNGVKWLTEQNFTSGVRTSDGNKSDYPEGLSVGISGSKCSVCHGLKSKGETICQRLHKEL